MRKIRGLALGTYYAKGADAAGATPNASQVRGLVYAVKDNRVPPNPKQPIQHRLHPLGRPIQVDRTNAIEYVTAMLANRIDRLTKFFKADDPDAIAGPGLAERRTAAGPFVARRARRTSTATRGPISELNLNAGAALADESSNAPSDMPGVCYLVPSSHERTAVLTASLSS